MIITMTDTSVKSLTRRVEEKLNVGYEMVTKFKREPKNDHFPHYIPKWSVKMRKVK